MFASSLQASADVKPAKNHIDHAEAMLAVQAGRDSLPTGWRSLCQLSQLAWRLTLQILNIHSSCKTPK